MSTVFSMNLLLIKKSQKKFKLKSKPWITKAIQFLWERDKIFHNYCKEDNVPRREILYSQFKKKTRNELTQKSEIAKLNITNLILLQIQIK